MMQLIGMCGLMGVCVCANVTLKEFYNDHSVI